MKRQRQLITLAGQRLVAAGIPLLLMATNLAEAANPAPAEMVRQLAPLSVRGVNYYPRETSWGGLWTKTPPEVWEKDMALAASLGINTVRTFVQFSPKLEQAGLLHNSGAPTPAYLEKIDQLLAIAWRHGIRLIVCLEFDTRRLATSGADAAWKRGFTAIISAHAHDGRVLLWDLMNEPDDDAKWTNATRAYLREALPLAHQLDTNHPTTIGLTWRIDRLKETGFPDVLQYHEYCPKTMLFKQGPARISLPIATHRQKGGARPLLIGEFGMSTARDPQFGAEPSLHSKLSDAPGTEAEQARLYQIVLTAAEKDQVAGVLAWCLHDYPIKNPNESHFGLVRADGTLKPAAGVLKNVYHQWKARP
ncbi:MAG: cellulase family glycosylhydrolase [Verrucomicrobiota bacterium]